MPSAAGDKAQGDVAQVGSKSLVSGIPDGLQTSGQHPPLYADLRPYDDFPKHIEGDTVWATAELQGNPQYWTHQLTEEEIAELSDAADRFAGEDIQLTGISKVILTNTRLASQQLTKC